MESKLVSISLFLLAVSGLLVRGTTVAPGKMGLKWNPRTTGLDDKPLREGFYWHMHWNDVFTSSVQWQSFTEKIDVLTRDDLHIQAEATLVARPMAKELYQLQLEIGPDFYPRIAKAEFLAAVRSTVANYAMVEVPEKSPEIEVKVLQSLRERILENISNLIM